MKTNEILLITDLEEKAKEEYLELMNDYREKLKREEEEAKKVKVVDIKKNSLNMNKKKIVIHALEKNPLKKK